MQDITYHQFTIELPDSLRAEMSQSLMDAGALGIIENDDSITAYFSRSMDPDAVRAVINDLALSLRADEKEDVIRIAYSILPHEDWNESWKRNFKPLPIGSRFTILPPWEPLPADGRIPLVIDPGMAFGTGHHETTRSCLILMEKVLSSVKRDRFLDLGTGTGLLAIAALKLGFREIEGIDNDPVAIDSARINLKLNNAETIMLSVGVLEKKNGAYDMIAANLISGTLIDLSDVIASHLNPGGIVIASGILREQGEEVAMAMQKAGLALQERLEDGKWVSFGFRR
ncbi:MAG: 50S ribosomal protein L11 methyltransferase [Nitrospiraceae bacterium]|nr:50S ribosomal protein L11 methyltransferase [Nitrospiraceae bacterium]